MDYCDYCGVELDTNMSSCPLCGLSVGEEHVVAPEKKSKPPVFKDKILSEIENMTLVFGTFTHSISQTVKTLITIIMNHYPNSLRPNKYILLILLFYKCIV